MVITTTYAPRLLSISSLAKAVFVGLIVMFIGCIFLSGVPLMVSNVDAICPNPLCTANDLDGDGLTNRDESFKYRTDPENPDTDGDRLNEGAEVRSYGSNFFYLIQMETAYKMGGRCSDGILQLMRAFHAQNLVILVYFITHLRLNLILMASDARIIGNIGTTTTLSIGLNHQPHGF
jgi:hypothetical protein